MLESIITFQISFLHQRKRQSMFWRYAVILCHLLNVLQYMVNSSSMALELCEHVSQATWKVQSYKTLNEKSVILKNMEHFLKDENSHGTIPVYLKCIMVQKNENKKWNCELNPLKLLQITCRHDPSLTFRSTHSAV